MKILKTKIPGLKLIKNIAHKDERGFFSETYRQKNFKKFLGKEPFCQDNHSFSKKNVLRGIHFQWKNPQSQLVYLVSGKIFVVFVDFRLNSKTFLKKFEVIIQAKDKIQYFMPAGVGSGYYSLSNLTHKIYKVNKYFNPKNEMGIHWSDEHLSVNWPKGKKIVSKKDNSYLRINEINFNKFNDLKKIN